jgi:hypothetical protein
VQEQQQVEGGVHLEQVQMVEMAVVAASQEVEQQQQQ